MTEEDRAGEGRLNNPRKENEVYLEEARPIRMEQERQTRLEQREIASIANIKAAKAWKW
jgi:hypothetical protein